MAAKALSRTGRFAAAFSVVKAGIF